jgi:hypothetical protein
MKGIRFILSRKNLLQVRLSIFDERADPKSGAFKLKWFEYGTFKRSTSKNKNRGTISATPFFMPAIRELEIKITKIYEDSFYWAINKIINRSK